MALSKVGRIFSRLPNCMNYNTKTLFVSKISHEIVPNRRTSIFAQLRKTPEKTRIRDQIPNNYKIIYRSTADRYLIGVQFFSCFSAVALLGLVLFNESPYYQPKPQEGKLIHSENENVVYACLMVCCIVVMQIVLLKVPVRIYRCPEYKNYSFIFRSVIPTATRQVNCTMGEIQRTINVNPIFDIMAEMQYVVKDQSSIILFDSSFQTPSELLIMLGEQKPNEDDEEDLY